MAEFSTLHNPFGPGTLLDRTRYGYLTPLTHSRYIHIPFFSGELKAYDSTMLVMKSNLKTFEDHPRLATPSEPFFYTYPTPNLSLHCSPHQTSSAVPIVPRLLCKKPLKMPPTTSANHGWWPGLLCGNTKHLQQQQQTNLLLYFRFTILIKRSEKHV